MRLAARIALRRAVALAGAAARGLGVRRRTAAARSRSRLKEETAKQTVLGFPALATKNTTRVGGEDPVADAAGVAHAVYPGHEHARARSCVTLVDAGRLAGGDRGRGADGAAAARARAARPTATTFPTRPPRRSTRSRRRGSHAAGGAQVMRIGEVAEPEAACARPRSPAGDPFALADAIDRFITEAAGAAVAERRDRLRRRSAASRCRPPRGPRSPATPCCSCSKDAIPAATERAIQRHQQPGDLRARPAER